jgi:alkanesulfonate monooxygenase SsuD/methylene tetrahydromethanopterin reductase-like flavin-dependent oxidoreductase (luciferase family)
VDIKWFFAGVAVADYPSALSWYEHLMGRPSDFNPHEHEAVWQIIEYGWIYVDADPGRAGKGLITLMATTRPLRFGIQAGPVDTPYPARHDYWREVERLAYDWASVGDHLMPNPVFGARDTDPWNEAWVTLAALAEATSRIRVGVLVTSVGFRHPAVLAKMAATLDVTSEGRLEFGIGAGYLEAEYRMYCIPFPSASVRIAQLDEAIQVCKLLWTQQRASFAGNYVSLADAVCEAKPVQRPHPPIWIGGGGEQKTLRVVAQHADGWNAFPRPSRSFSTSSTYYAAIVPRWGAITTRSGSNWYASRSFAPARRRSKSRWNYLQRNGSCRLNRRGRWRSWGRESRLRRRSPHTSALALTCSS